MLTMVWASLAEPPTPAEVKVKADVGPVRQVRVVVFDFVGPGGKELTDAIRLHLGSEQDCEVVDAAAMRGIGSPPTMATNSRRARTLMARLGADVALWGEARSTPGSLAAVARCIDLSRPRAAREWAKTFTDSSERPGQEVARQIVEAVGEKADWTRPQRGDESEPNDFSAPVNVNGDFEQGPIGWDAPDGVSTFLVDGPAERGVVLKIRTDLARRPWLDYRRALLLGQADPNNLPQVPPDRSTKSVAGTEGVHYCSNWIAAQLGRRYWLAADFKCGRTGEAFPRIFVKGFADTSDSARRLPERSLAERNLTPRDFAALPKERQKELIAEDA